MVTNIGFVGLGRMGHHMASNLLKAKFSLKLWNRSPDKMNKLINANPDCNVEIMATPRELAATSDVIITMLADDDASCTVHFSGDGLFAFSPQSSSVDKVFIEMGTMSPNHIKALVDKEQTLPIKVVDAPVSGSTPAAQQGSLMIMVGGDELDLKHISGLFTTMGSQCFYLGAAGKVATMKVIVNSLLHGLNQTLSEGLVLTKTNGIDLDLAFDILEHSAVAAPMLKYRRSLYLDESSQEVTFTVSLVRKDMELAEQLSYTKGLQTPQLQINLDWLKRAEREGFGDRDMAAMVNYMRQVNHL